MNSRDNCPNCMGCPALDGELPGHICPWISGRGAAQAFPERWALLLEPQAACGVSGQGHLKTRKRGSHWRRTPPRSFTTVDAYTDQVGTCTPPRSPGSPGVDDFSKGCGSPMWGPLRGSRAVRMGRRPWAEAPVALGGPTAPVHTARDLAEPRFCRSPAAGPGRSHP